VLTLQGTMTRELTFKQDLCADLNGFRLHPTVHCGDDEGSSLDQLCRYVTRSAPANERVQCNAGGRAVLKLNTP
jgi:hypothetical protein